MILPDGITNEDVIAESLITTVCGSADQKFNTIALAKRALAEGVPGDFAECGVCAGTQPALMAYVLQRYGGRDRKVHLFDSFSKGFSVERVHTVEDAMLIRKGPLNLAKDWMPGASRDGIDIAKCEPTGEVMTTIEQVQENMAKWRVNRDLLVYHIGWVQETLPALAAAGKMPTLALLRVDVDFYSPTAFIFEHLYDRVSPGGYIISDDWGEYDLEHPDPHGCRLAAFNFFDKRGLPRPKVERVSCGTVWWRKP